MAARRSASGGGERPRKHRPKLGHDTLSELKNSYVRENLRSRKVAPIFVDLRGNAVSVHSTGHIHHPCRFSTHWKWARLVELLFESAIFGLRTPLEMTCRVFRSGVKANP